MFNQSISICCLLALATASCTTARHGSFIPSSHIDPGHSRGESLGMVTGVSTQPWLLYLLPNGPAPSTDDAIQDAMSKHPGTKYLTNISIDDRTNWKIGYHEEVIRVQAEAHR